MCGRFSLEANKMEILGHYGLRTDGLGEDWQPREEVFPSDKILFLGREGWDLGNWGIQVDFLNHRIINSRWEKIYEPGFFRRDFEENRVLIPATSFFEWDQNRPSRDRYKITAEGRIFSFAGIRRNSDEIGLSILTRPAQGAMAKLHRREPIILPSSLEQRYLYDKDGYKLWKDLGRLSVDLSIKNTSNSQLSFL